MSTTVYIGLGSNLEAPIGQIRQAQRALEGLPGTRLRRQSGLYRSVPMGPPDQPDYINAVSELETGLAAGRLLDELQALERAQGRRRGAERWGPRTLDLDLLLYGAQRIDTPELQVPHPGLPERAFVLYPLAEIVPELDIPGLGPLRTLLARCPPEGLERLDDPMP